MGTKTKLQVLWVNSQQQAVIPGLPTGTESCSFISQPVASDDSMPAELRVGVEDIDFCKPQALLPRK